jgi:hypothetical protein
MKIFFNFPSFSVVSINDPACVLQSWISTSRSCVDQRESLPHEYPDGANANLKQSNYSVGIRLAKTADGQKQSRKACHAYFPFFIH